MQNWKKNIVQANRSFQLKTNQINNWTEWSVEFCVCLQSILFLFLVNRCRFRLHNDRREMLSAMERRMVMAIWNNFRSVTLYLSLLSRFFLVIIAYIGHLSSLHRIFTRNAGVSIIFSSEKQHSAIQKRKTKNNWRFFLDRSTITDRFLQLFAIFGETVGEYRIEVPSMTKFSSIFVSSFLLLFSAFSPRPIGLFDIS